MSKGEVCSFFIFSKTRFGPNGGDRDTVLLRKCCDVIFHHLRTCHLSREEVTEVELLLARAGLLDLEGGGGQV